MADASAFWTSEKTEEELCEREFWNVQDVARLRFEGRREVTGDASEGCVRRVDAQQAARLGGLCAASARHTGRWAGAIVARLFVARAGLLT